MYLLNISVNSYLLKMKIEPLDLYWMLQKYEKKDQKLRELLDKCNFKYVPPNLHAYWGSNGTISYKLKDKWSQNWEIFIRNN